MDALKEFECVDCGENTHFTNEYYMVQFELWNEYGAGDGMLCVGCLENRIGRKLNKADFFDCPVNNGIFGLSERLINRMSN